jgi:3-methyladenine DNA glycosylase AlkC
MFREETIRRLAEALQAAGPLDIEAFMADAMEGLETLELKDRVRHLSAVLRRHLDADYGVAVAHILRALPPPLARDRTVTSGFVIWPLCQFVEDHGVNDPDISLPALYELTRRFSAEFAIRPFLIEYPDRTLALLEDWADDQDQHVRRLVSEGSRPRLPWGQRLHFLVENPSPLLPLLEKLRDDPEEYVRRSVANNLNDIAKDNPDVVVDLCRRWLKGASKETQRLVRHALRSLIKQGHPGALELLGFGPPEVKIVSFTGPEEATIGDSVQLELSLRSKGDQQQNLVIDYALHFPGANGKTNRKVFKWRTTKVEAGKDLQIRHTHSFRPITTRPTRPGTYLFELLINGQSSGEHELVLGE